MPPTVVLVPGMACVASVIYAPLIKQLKAAGISDTHAINLPSVDPQELLQPNPLQVDIDAIHNVLSNLIDQKGFDVVLIAHSYGGAPAMGAVEGLWHHLRKKQGKKGGVVKVGLLSSTLNLPGDTVKSNRDAFLEDHPETGANAKVEMTDKGLLIYPDGLKEEFLADFPAAEMEHWGSTLRPFALEAVLLPSPPADVSAWEISYLLTEDDFTMPVKFQETLIERARKAGAEVEVKRISSGHFPQINRADEVVQWIQSLLE